MMYSYHIFYFPFKWEIDKMKNCVFSEQIALCNINYLLDASGWERTPDISENEKIGLYNEKNYYYPFVHPILYDENNAIDLIRHFERKETKNDDVFYYIKKKGREQPYKLKVDAINLNLYSTGVGFLSFYLKNEDETQSAPNDILYINQFGRRVMPPFFADIEGRNETAEYIKITGLYGNADKYKDDFKLYTPHDHWKPAKFICSLIDDLATNIVYSPVIDERMFVVSCYKNDYLATLFENDLSKFLCAEKYTNKETEDLQRKGLKDFWYRYLFIDSDSATCQNFNMRKELLQEHTYCRWQEWSSLYGISKYSMVYLTNSNVPDYLINYYQTIYARMVELVLVQRASMLRFSGEITKVSKLSNEDSESISKRISSIYKEYIRFINQIYFREVTAQDQGIELYTMLQDSLKMKEYITDLDDEIGELYNYVSMIENREQNKKAAFLNNIATIFIPVTIITGFFGMNNLDNVICESINPGIWIQIALIAIGTILAFLVIYNKKKKRL